MKRIVTILLIALSFFPVYAQEDQNLAIFLANLDMQALLIDELEKNEEASAETVSLLLSYDSANPDNGKISSDTLLTYAIANCSDEVILAIINSGKADVNIADNYGNTPLFHELGKDDEASLDIVQALLDKGADPNTGESWGYPPLIYSIAYCSEDITMAILNSGLADVNKTDNYDSTPLMRELEKDDEASLDVVQTLLDQGADPNTGESWGYPPLIYSIAYCSEDITMAILNSGLADVNKTDDYDGTPLLRELEKDDDASLIIINALLRNGADTTLGESWGYNPVEYAAVFCSEEIAETLKNAPVITPAEPIQLNEVPDSDIRTSAELLNVPYEELYVLVAGYNKVV